jgi:hypothetical protein
MFATTSLLADRRFTVEGDTLVFDMTIEESGHKFTQQLERYDVNLLSDYLFEHPEIKILKLTGPGGFMPAARDMAAKIIEFNLNTVAYGECASACTTIFLAGNKRSLETSAKLGFHRQWVDKEQEKLYYNAMKETKGWKNEFDYIAWIYDVLADNIVKDIEFMESRGVSMDFILKALSKASYDMWEPSRDELTAAGIVTQ